MTDVHSRHYKPRKTPYFSPETRAKLGASGGQTDRTDRDKNERSHEIERAWTEKLCGWRFDGTFDEAAPEWI